MIVFPLRKSNVLSFTVFAWKLFSWWMAYLLITVIYRTRPLRKLVSRLDIVGGKTCFKSKRPAAEFVPATQA